jgi:hypothetical protein
VSTIKVNLLIILMALSFAAAGICQDRPTQTYYTNQVPYAAFFENQETTQLKVQVRTKDGKRIQAEIPVVNDAEKDITQKKGD